MQPRRHMQAMTRVRGGYCTERGAPMVPFCPCRLANLSPTCGMRMERTCAHPPTSRNHMRHNRLTVNSHPMDPASPKITVNTLQVRAALLYGPLSTAT